MALGEDVTPDYRALPRATYTDPEAAFVGVIARGRAARPGIDAFELVADFATSPRGYAVEATLGHLTIVVDRGDPRAGRRGDRLPRRLRRDPRVRARDPGARPGRRRSPPTIHAFPSTSRILNGLFADALRELASPGASSRPTDAAWRTR